MPITSPGSRETSTATIIIEEDTTRKWVEEALWESEEKYHLLAETVRDIIVVTNIEGKVVYLNKAAQEITGYSEEEAFRINVKDIVLPELKYIAEMSERFKKRQRRDKSVYLYETEIISKAGQVIPVEASSSLLVKQDGSANIIMIARDITERKRAEKALKRHNLELTELNAIIATITATLDLDQVLQRIIASVTNLFPHASGATIQLSDEATGNLLTRAASQNLPARPQQLVFGPGEGIAGLAIRERRLINVADVTTDPHFVPGPAEPPFRSLLVAPLLFGERSLGTLSLEGTVPMAFGTEDEWLVESLAGYAATAVENARLFQESQRQSRELAVLYDTALATSSVLETEVLLQRIYEQVQQLIAPDTFAVALYDADSEEIEFALVMEEGEQVPEATNLRVPPEKGGLTGWVMRVRQPLLVGDLQANRLPVEPRHVTRPARAWLGVPLIVRDRLIGALSVQSFCPHAFDDAHRRLLESLAGQIAIALENARLFAHEEQRAVELARALEQQQELDRLKDELIQNVSHELRTPLAIVRGYAELLDSGDLGKLQPNQREPIAIIVRRTRTLSKLVDDINAILEIESQESKRESVDWASLVRQQSADFQATAKQAGLTLTTQVAPNLAPILGDSAQLQRVLDNLLGNALKFTPAGGRIAVRLEQEGKNLALKVADTGIGIPGNQSERIFERFYQIDGSMTRRYGGTGLGLALVKEIVGAHGGKVSVESKVDQGSTFTVTLPVYKS